MEMNTISGRSKNLLTDKFVFGFLPDVITNEFETLSCPFKEQYVLRMMIRKNGGEFFIPNELKWLESLILYTKEKQIQDGMPDQPFVYVTVRHAKTIMSKTDDIWHVDGFSMRVPHPPEQNYLLVLGESPTQFLKQKIKLPNDFDPFVHNIHLFFNFEAIEDKKVVGDIGTLFRIDPYCIHRRPPIEKINNFRTMIRISFIPIEIEDDTCFINPLMPKQKMFNRKDIRETLKNYHESKRAY